MMRFFSLSQELNLTNFILFPGYIPDDNLPLWYSAAEIFIYPSLLEGFGLPVLEAMACGTPVICSDIPSLREVAGDSALTFGAEEEQRLAALIGEVLQSTTLQRELRARGKQQAARFSWQQTAKATIEVYRAT